MDLYIKWHREEKYNLSSVAFGCNISKDVSGTFGDAIAEAENMISHFAKAGIVSVEIVSAATGEVYATISDLPIS